MSKVKTEFGWQVDEEYYIYNANTQITADGAKKDYDGSAIIAAVFKENTSVGYTVEISSTYNAARIGGAAYSTVVNGVTWYIARAGGWYYEADKLDWMQKVVTSVDAYWIDQGASANPIIVSDILAASGYEVIPKIATTNYVQKFVEGVEAETASRVNTLDTEKQPKTMSSAITVDGTSQTTVEDALGAINTLAAGNKTNIGTLSTLKTTAKTDLVSAINELKGTVYTFHIDPGEADSYDAVTYHDDAVGMVPASMGATTFNYGSWENAFFMPKPCMLKFDGTVDYYLNRNDYSKKTDGTASDVADLSYPGNAMMEFPLIWWKSWGDGWVSIADYQVDVTYKCWSNLDADGNIIPYFYLPIYNGVIYDGKMRSISGIQLKSWSTTAYSNSATYAVGDEVNHNSRMWKCITAVETPEEFDSAKWEQFAFNGNTTGEEEITYATANNTTAKVEWYTDVWCDRVLINVLLVLIGKCIDTQGTFGRGIDSGEQAAKENYVTGSLDNKGLFYGSTSNGSTAVKVFGMENWWAFQCRRVAGLIGSTSSGNNTYLYKMTASTADGTTVKGYNTTGSGYLTASGRPSEHNWLKKMQFGQFGALPLEVGSYSTQYYKDHYWTGTGYALFGGSFYDGSYCGAFCLHLSDGVRFRYWSVGAAPSCKPCAIKEAIINE